MHLQSLIWIYIMNKTSIIFLGVILTFSEKSISDTVTININAHVVERSCTILNDALNMTVNLKAGDLRQSRRGIPFGEMPFSISLTDYPDNISTAYIKFSGESDTTMNNLLKNVNGSETAAQGVALGLYNIKNENINIQSNEERLSINHGQSTHIFNFSASYVKTSDTTSAGKIISIVDFELSYD